MFFGSTGFFCFRTKGLLFPKTSMLITIITNSMIRVTFLSHQSVSSCCSVSLLFSLSISIRYTSLNQLHHSLSTSKNKPDTPALHFPGLQSKKSEESDWDDNSSQRYLLCCWDKPRAAIKGRLSSNSDSYFLTQRNVLTCK